MSSGQPRSSFLPRPALIYGLSLGINLALAGLVAVRAAAVSWGGFFFGGAVLGIVLLWADENWLHRYYQSELKLKQPVVPSQPTSSVTPTELITRSLLFLISLVPISIFVLTSTGNLLGSGLVMGLLITLAVELTLWRRDIQQFNSRFVSQAKKPLTSDEIKWGVIGFWGWVGLMVGLLIW